MDMQKRFMAATPLLFANVLVPVAVELFQFFNPGGFIGDLHQVQGQINPPARVRGFMGRGVGHEYEVG